MCLAIPAKLVKVEKTLGTIDFAGVTREVDLTLVPGIKVGDYVLVHAGFAIQIIDEEEALKTLELFKELGELSNEIST